MISDRLGGIVRPFRRRFDGFDTVMVVDEFGNVGKDPKRSETKFGYAVSVTEDPNAFVLSTADERRGRRDELKARDSGNQISVARRIHSAGTRTYAYYVDKKDPPKGWDNKDRSKVMRSILRYSIKKTLPETNGDVYVVVDHHSAYKGKVRGLIHSFSRPWKIVDGDDFESHEGLYSDILQTHDHVANSVRSHLESGDRRRTKILRTRVYKIKGDELCD